MAELKCDGNEIWIGVDPFYPSKHRHPNAVFRAALLTVCALLVGCAKPESRVRTSRFPSAEAAISPELLIRPIGDEAWVAVHTRPWLATMVLVEMPDGTLVLCDTPYTNMAAAVLMDWIREQAGQRRLVVINGHGSAWPS
jgi:hypothetical protein